MNSARLSDFDYRLPKERIAAYPPKERTSARLLYVDRTAHERSHRVFRDLETLLRPGDVLVLNDTKVIPARLFGKKKTGGRVEALLLRQNGDGRWHALLRPGGRIRQGAVIDFGENGSRLEAEVLSDPVPDSGEREIRFLGKAGTAKLEKIGHVPLPPYLDRPDTPLDREMYQTVFARKAGAVASPTAGLHFDRPLLERLEARGVEIAYVTLHVSYGTFQPIAVEDLSKHVMFEENYEISPETAEAVSRARVEGRRVIACGTTVVRTLESSAARSGRLEPGRTSTRLFIRPPYSFKIVDGLITNFHLPKSSLFVLVSAFYDRARLIAAYEEAIRAKYRFYSYGDAMLLL